MVRIRYWHQDTLESGWWALSGLIPDEAAESMLALYVQSYGEAKIVPADYAEGDNNA